MSSIWAVVPAAGLGRRMGGELPKQYLPLGGKTVIEHSLECLLGIEEIDGLVVVLHKHDDRFASLPVSNHQKVITVVGGQERSDSVLAALNRLQKKVKLSDWVLVHDAVRCCVSGNKIKKLIQFLEHHEVGGILGVPANDSPKQINSEQQILSSLDQQTVWLAQTPQMFRFGLLREALQQAQRHQREVVDEAAALEFLGYLPNIVMGEYSNIKITHPEDLAIAEIIMKRQLV